MPFRWPWSRKSRGAAPTSEVAPYYVLGGRRLVLDGPYMLPKDIEESSRLDFQHIMLRNILRGNYLAPIHNPLSILDVGSGTGRWGIDMASQFPNANVVGVDVVAVPVSSIASARGETGAVDNYTFVQADITQGLPFADNSFDFVHMRLVVLGLPYNQWRPVVQELRRVTRVGGWIELVDTSVTARSPGAEQWTRWAQTLATFRGIDMTAGDQVGRFLQEAGIRNVQQIPLEIPLGDWGGRIGIAMATDGLAGAKALKVPIVQQAHLATEAEFDAAIRAIENDWKTMHGVTQPFYIAFGQK